MEWSPKLAWAFKKNQQNIGVGVVRNGCDHPSHKVNEWMNEWTELIFHADANSGKLRITYLVIN